MDTIKQIGEIAIWAAGVATALASLWEFIVKPIKDIKTTLAVVVDDTGELMGDRLSQAHDHWMELGYCPKADKRRLLAMHKRYAEMGRNHLAEHYERDIIELPEEKERY